VQKENDELRAEVERAQQPGSATEEELVELKEEFSRRLGSADQTIARLQVSGQVTSSCAQALSDVQVASLLVKMLNSAATTACNVSAG